MTAFELLNDYLNYQGISSTPGSVSHIQEGCTLCCCGHVSVVLGLTYVGKRPVTELHLNT